MSLSFALPFILASTQAPAVPAAGWQVGKGDDSPVVLSRTSEGVTIEYHLISDDYDWMRLTVASCGSGPWWIKDSLAPPGDTAPEHASFVRKTIMEDFHNARLNCQLADGIEDRFMTGFDAAWTQFEALKNNAQTH